MHSKRIKNTLSTHARYKCTASVNKKPCGIWSFRHAEAQQEITVVPNCQLGETEGSRIYLGNPPPTTNNNYNQHLKKCQVKITMRFKKQYKDNAMYAIINLH